MTNSYKKNQTDNKLTKIIIDSMKKEDYQSPIIKVVSFMIESGFDGTLKTDKTVQISEDVMSGNQRYGNVSWDENGYF